MQQATLASLFDTDKKLLYFTHDSQRESVALSDLP